MKKLTTTLLLSLTVSCYAMDIPISLFPIEAFSQEVKSHLMVDDEEYHHPLLTSSYQQKQLAQFYEHYYSSEGLSPWSEQTVSAILPLVYTLEASQLHQYDNTVQDTLKQHYAENLRPHDKTWWQHLQTKMQLEALQSLKYDPSKRAILTEHTLARNLPDEAPDFYHPSIAGQGFPFDNLQDASLWMGTPVYVIASTQDKAWSLIITPDAYITWIKTKSLAFASDQFIKDWQKLAKEQLIATTKTEASLLDQDSQYLSTSFIGHIFPLIEQTHTHFVVALPFKNKQGWAEINIGKILISDAAKMPIVFNKANIANLLSELKNRPYGWGGTFFFNDCSLELKNLFTPFALWLPRNSAQQAKMGPTIDLSELSSDRRSSVIQDQGHPLLTLIYIPGHIMLYVGKEKFHEKTVPMTYQNIWGLQSLTNDHRYVIGQSLFFPLLDSYPMQPDAKPLLTRPIFKLVFLDAQPQTLESPTSFSKRFSQIEL